MGCASSKPAVRDDNSLPSSPPLASSTTQAGGANGVHIPPQQAPIPAAGATHGEAKEMVQPSSPNRYPSKRQSRGRLPRNSSAANVGQTDSGPAQDYQGVQLVTAENDRLTHIVTLASSIMKAALCFVVLGQKDRMVLAKAVGIEDQDKTWLPAACAWTLNQDSGLMVVENMETDDRTKALEWVRQDPQVGFYAGVPVCTTSGQRLGCLCILDFEPRPGMTMICQSLTNLSEMVAREVQAEEQMNSGEELLNRAIDTYWDACVYLDAKQDTWRINYVNEAFVTLTGMSAEEVAGKDLWDIIELTGSAVPEDAFKKMSETLKKQLTHDIEPIVFSQGRAAKVGSMASRKLTYKISMRPMRQMHITNYSLPFNEEEAKGLFFAVISPFSDSSSRGQFAIVEMDLTMIPFEGVELGPIIGKGSFGSVFKATWSGRIVAIKIIPFSDIAKVDASGQPLEASLMLDMKHPNIVETYQHALQSSAVPKVQEDDTSSAKHTSAGSQTSTSSGLQFWLMLEFCDVGTLSDGLEMGLLHETLQDGDSSLLIPKVTFILETLRDIASGMEFVHSYNILHSDLTAGNVLLDSTDAGVQGNRNFVAKIADFGLSRQALTSKVETNTYGTVTHMPPELLNEGHVSKAADVYAFGVLVYEVYTKKPVWEGLRHPQIIHAIAVQKKHPQLPESAPAAIRELANSCMAAEPHSRPTFTEVIAMIDKMF